MKMEYKLEEINSLAKQILNQFPHVRCFAFYAQMGCGKTTLINELCKQLEVIDATSSPTFSIINEYKTIHNQSIFHMDWYRLKGEEDAFEAGVQDIIAQKEVYCFIEWPEIAAGLLPMQYLKIEMQVLNVDTRLFEAEMIG